MTIKYQIFVSSTYEDLKHERNQVIKAVLQMGHIPIGMEMFNAANEAQWMTIKRHIDETDYYVVIIAHRYGSVTNEGISYTEKEFDYALSKNIPTLAFIIHDTASWPPTQVDRDHKKSRALTAFKDEVKQRHICFWNTADDLPGKVAMALTQAMNMEPRVGWVQTSRVRDLLSKATNNTTLCIDITNIALINHTLSVIGASNSFGAYVELKGHQIRDFQDAGIKALSIKQQNNPNTPLVIFAFDITKEPEILA